MESVGIGLLGLGTVGTEVARRLIEEWELLGERAGATPVLRCVAVRDVSKPRDVDLKNVRLVADPEAVVADPAVAIVVEVMGGTDPATALIESALRAGKSGGDRQQGRDRRVGSSPERARGRARRPPVFRGERRRRACRSSRCCARSLLGDRISALDCVINGTTNVILTQMRIAWGELRQRARRCAAPRFRRSGSITRRRRLGRRAQARDPRVAGARRLVAPDAVDRVGIRDVAAADVAALAQLGYRVRLLAHAERASGGAVHLRVRPTAVGAGHLLHDVDDADNAVIISSDLAATVMLRGLGAGGDSTASAVVSDVVTAVRERGAPREFSAAARVDATMLGDEDVEVAGYVRVRLSTEADARALVHSGNRGPRSRRRRGRRLAGSELIVLTGMAPRAVHDRALETLDTLTSVDEILGALDRVEA